MRVEIDSNSGIVPPWLLEDSVELPVMPEPPRPVTWCDERKKCNG